MTNSARRHQHSRRGFTTLELVVVLTVIAIVAAIGVTTYSMVRGNATKRTVNETTESVARNADAIAESRMNGLRDTTDADIEASLAEADIWDGTGSNNTDLNPADPYTWSKTTNTLTYLSGSRCMQATIKIDTNGDGIADENTAADGIRDTAVTGDAIECSAVPTTTIPTYTGVVPGLAQGVTTPVTWTVDPAITAATLTDPDSQVTFANVTISGTTLRADATVTGAATPGRKTINVNATGAALSSLPLDIVSAYADLGALGAELVAGADTIAPTDGWMLTVNGATIGEVDGDGVYQPGFDYVSRTGNFTIGNTFDATEWFTATADTRGAVVAIDGNLTITEGTVFTPPVRKLFFYVHVTGTLTVDGELTMTQRGANHSGVGTSGGLVEPVNIRVATGVVSGVTNPTIPAAGGAGGAAVNLAAAAGAYRSGVNGNAAPTGGTGGGGSGETYSTSASGAGSAGTSYSGGTGGGGARSGVKAADGGIYGGAGGDGLTFGGDGTAGGGVGNPGGNGWSWGTQNVNLGGTGTAGTMIVRTNAIAGIGSITSVGVTGGGGASSGGNGGGGSIHVLAATGTPGVTLNASGGGANGGGGLGGAGSVTCVVSPDAGVGATNSFCAPPAPTADMFTDMTTVKVNWVAPTTVAEAPVTGYRVRIATNPAGPFTDTSYTTATLTHTFTGLSASTTYYIHVQANSALGWGAPRILTTTTLASAAPTVQLLAGTGTGSLVNGAGTSATFNRPLFTTVGPDGTVYVADAVNHRIRAIAADATVSTYAGITQRYLDGPAAEAQFNTPWATATAADGTVYIADASNHRIRVMSPSGTVTTLAGSGTAAFADGTGAAASFNTPTDLVLTGDGNLLVADSANHRIRQVTPAGVVTTFAGTGTAGYLDGTNATARFSSPSGLALRSDGSVLVADRGTHRIRLISGGNTSNFAGTGTAGYLDGTNATARFNTPYGVAVAGDGTVYVADTTGHRIRAISGGNTTTVAGTGVAGYLDSANATAVFSSPTDVSVFSNGDILVTDQSNHRLRLISGGNTTTVAGAGAGLTNATGTAAQFNTPRRTEILSDGSIVIADGNNHVIRKTTSGYAATTHIGTTVLHHDNSRLAAMFNSPAGIIVAGDGTMYVADSSNHVIRKITPAGTVSTIAGSPGQTGTADGSGATARFNSPYGLAFATNGDILVADYNNHAIRRVTPAGAVTTIAGIAGTSGYVDGPAGSARLNRPRDVVQRADGSIAWTEGANHIIRLLDGGTVSTFAGTPTVAGYINATGRAARFNDPIGLIELPDGSLLVADFGNHRLRLVTTARVVTLYSGLGSGYTNGALGDARFTNPSDVVRASSGALYIVDYGTHRMRRIS